MSGKDESLNERPTHRHEPGDVAAAQNHLEAVLALGSLTEAEQAIAELQVAERISADLTVGQLNATHVQRKVTIFPDDHYAELDLPGGMDENGEEADFAVGPLVHSYTATLHAVQHIENDDDSAVITNLIFTDAPTLWDLPITTLCELADPQLPTGQVAVDGQFIAPRARIGY